MNSVYILRMFHIFRVSGFCSILHRLSKDSKQFSNSSSVFIFSPLNYVRARIGSRSGIRAPFFSSKMKYLTAAS